MGYLQDNRFALLNADTDVFTTFEGDNTVLLQLVTKGLLTNSQDSFESMDSRAMVLFGARQFAGAVIERVIGGSVVQRLIAWGHIDRLLLDALARATEECEDAEAKGVLDALCDLFVHATVEANAAWFLEHGRIFAKQSKDVTLAVGRLCADRPSHALTIVDAFGIPDGFVEAKVAAGLTRRSGVREAPPLDDRILHSIGQPRRDPTDP